jgi:hypothetical protein
MPYSPTLGGLPGSSPSRGRPPKETALLVFMAPTQFDVIVVFDHDEITISQRADNSENEVIYIKTSARAKWLVDVLMHAAKKLEQYELEQHELSKCEQ